MWPFKKKPLWETMSFAEFGRRMYKEGLDDAKGLFSWWDDMKPGWEYLKKNSHPSICPFIPTSWYIQTSDNVYYRND